MATIKECDRCGAQHRQEALESKEIRPLVFQNADGVLIANGKQTHTELCLDCWKKLRVFLGDTSAG